jgi:hypothetical protein
MANFTAVAPIRISAEECVGMESFEVFVLPGVKAGTVVFYLIRAAGIGPDKVRGVAQSDR